MALQLLPEISNYGHYSSNNYGAHTLRIDMDRLTLWYSYDAIVAFNGGEGRKVCENVWCSTTTGKHLNWIDGGDKKRRLPREQFVKELTETLSRLGYSKI